MLKHYSKRIVKQLLSPVADFTGIHDRKISRLMTPTNRLLVLMYHRVIEDVRADPFQLGMCVQMKHFAKQLAWLSRHAHVLPLQEAVERLLQQKPLPPCSVAITFDDGYLDNLTLAGPMLEQHGLPATFYIVTGGLEEGSLLWWDQVIAILGGTQARSLDTQALGLTELPATLSLSAIHRRDTCIRLLASLWQRNAADIHQAIRQMRSMLKPRYLSQLDARRMTSKQVQFLAGTGPGFTIGDHTVSHIDPRHLTQAQLRDELFSSRRALQELCQQPIDSFAYPAGRISVCMPDLLAKAGFHHAVTTERGINQYPCNRYEIARIGMPDTPVGDFKRAIRNLQTIDASH